MSPVEAFLAELDAALLTRGRSRRRLLTESRDHLLDSTMQVGESEAVRRFGSPTELARSFDTGTAVRRGSLAAGASALGVLSVGASALALVNAADPHAAAVPVWAVLFFLGAQAAALCGATGVARAAVMWRSAATPADVAVVCRRSLMALAFSAMTLIAAGGAIPGQAPVWPVAAGPVVAVLAAVLVVRARRLARGLGAGSIRRRARARDRFPAPVTGANAVVTATAVLVGAAAAAAWDRLDHGGLHTTVAAAGTEAVFVAVACLVLAPALGLRVGPPRRPAHVARVTE